MKKYLISLFILFCVPLASHADLSISEIMYDASGTDTDHEWIEVYNPGTTTVTLDGWQFSDGANHNLNKPPTNGSTGDFTVPAGGYVIFAANAVTFLSDHSGFDGEVIDTVMSLNNTGATLKLLQDGVEQDSLSYSSSMGAAGDGNTLQIVDGELASGAPTPGASNEAGGATTTDTTTPLPDEVATVIPPMSATLTIPTLITSGIDVPFKSLINDYGDTGEKLQLEAGVFKWNFGDGTAVTLIDQSSISHKYIEPGDYVVYFEYSKNKDGAFITDVSKRVNISVQPAGITITNVSADGKISIKNSSSREQDISSWNISDKGRMFVFAENTIILAGKTLTLGESVLGFKPLTSDVINLNKPSGESTSVYRPVYVPPAKKVVATVTKPVSRALPTPPPSHIEELTPAPQVLSASTNDKEQISVPKKSVTPYLAGTAFGVLVIGSVFGTIKIRRRRMNNVENDVEVDDFRILEE